MSDDVAVAFVISTLIMPLSDVLSSCYIACILGYGLTDVKTFKSQLTPVPTASLKELLNYVCYKIFVFHNYLCMSLHRSLWEEQL